MNVDAWKAEGIDSINCMAVNDAFVMAAWGEAHEASDKVRMRADPAGDFAVSMGPDVNAAVLGGERSKRSALVVEGGEVTHLQVEPDGFGLPRSLAEGLLEQI